MARQMKADQDTAYRVVVNFKGMRYDSTPYDFTSIYGPYASAATAKGILTQKAAEYRYHDKQREVTGYVEKSSTVWERI